MADLEMPYAQSSFPSGGAEDSHENDNTGDKRKRQREGSNSTGRKRNRYISIACNECKRRKIKCNGENPCQRCGNLKLQCVYEAGWSGSLKQSSEFKQLTDQVEHLQHQVQYLLQNLNQLRNSIGQNDFPEMESFVGQTENQQEEETDNTMMAPAATMVIDPELASRNKTTPQRSRFQGPTSPAFSLGMAQNTLSQMGIGFAQPAEQSLSGGSSMQNQSETTSRALHSTKDPIWAVKKEEALRLCRVFEDENGLLYPFLDMQHVMRHATLLFSFIDSFAKTVVLKDMPGSDDMQDEDTDVLKLVLAIAMVTEGGGQSDLGRRLFDYVDKDINKRLLGSVGLKDIQILTLKAIYHFHSDDEGLAWRVIGMTARLCIELGLHRAETYKTKFAQPQERTAAIKLFWSVYVLDHRWSMGTGMSFALPDADIDKSLPRPEQSSPYLNTMIQYSQIGAQVWRSVSGADTSAGSNGIFSTDQAKYLDYQIQEWYRSVPEELHFVHPLLVGTDRQDADQRNQNAGRGMYRLRCLLYLRYSQMRIIIYRPILHSTQAISSHLHAASLAVDTSKDTIRVLNYINQGGDIYRTQQMTWNHFLLTALAALALAMCHAPGTFADTCRDELYTAIELVRGLSGDSYVSKRLWRAIRNIRELAPRLCNNRPQQQLQEMNSSNLYQHFQPDRQRQNEAQRSAAMVMAGLATGQPVDESAFFANNAQASADLDNNITRSDQSGHLVTSPNGMANELTYLFEAAGALNGNAANAQWPNAFAGQDMQQGRAHAMQGQQAGMSGDGGWGQDNEELGRILRELY